MNESPRWPIQPMAAVERGQWVIDELGSWATIAGIVPSRFDAFARIFHPTGGRELHWDGEEVRFESEHSVRWAEVAARLGTVLHPLAQWHSLTADYRQPADLEDGWECWPPPTGVMDLHELAAVAEVLARHTSTPEECVATLWGGHGEINGSMVRVILSSDGDAWEESTPTLHPAMAEALTNPRLNLPGRESLLFELDIRDLADPAWAERSGWADDLSVLTPQALWPEGREWFLASEIDFDSTVVGGSPELVRELLDLGEAGIIEVRKLPNEADLTSAGDTVNQRGR